MILIGCEESQAVTIEMRKLGITAFSCDILPCSGGHPEWHIHDDVLKVMRGGWKHIISFPPCTDLTVSGAKWFEQKRNDGRQEASIRFFFEVWKNSSCTENPIGILNGGKYIQKWFPDLFDEMKKSGFPFTPSQIIQPWQFGHGETKATCLWLKGLPLLRPTKIVSGREQKIWRMPPTPDRAKIRSKTFPGIAEAFAKQWQKYLK